MTVAPMRAKRVDRLRRVAVRDAEEVNALEECWNGLEVDNEFVNVLVAFRRRLGQAFLGNTFEF